MAWERMINGGPLLDLARRLAQDERCPEHIREQLRIEIPALESMRADVLTHKETAELPPHTSFIERASTTLGSLELDENQIATRVRSSALQSRVKISRTESLNLGKAIIDWLRGT